MESEEEFGSAFAAAPFVPLEPGLAVESPEGTTGLTAVVLAGVNPSGMDFAGACLTEGCSATFVPVVVTGFTPYACGFAAVPEANPTPSQ